MSADEVGCRYPDPQGFFLQTCANARIRFLLKYAVLAPSTHNSQPWLFRVKGDECEIFIEPSVRIVEADPLGRDLFVSLGACVESLVIASRAFGVYQSIEYRLSDRSVALLRFTGLESPDQWNRQAGTIVDAIGKRYNARGGFQEQRLGSDVIDALRNEVLEPGINLHVLEDRERIEALAALTGEGVRIAYRSRAFRKEMASWLNSNWSSKTTGLHGYALGMPAWLSIVFPRVVRFGNPGGMLARLNWRSVSSAPAVVVLSSKASEPLTWLEVGRSAFRLMLAMTRLGIETSVFSAALEIGDLNRDVQGLLRINETPHFLFCVGHTVRKLRPSPRTSVDAKMVSEDGIRRAS